MNCSCNSSDPLIRLVNCHEAAGAGTFLYKAASRSAEELGLSFDAKARNPRGDPTSLASLESRPLRAKTKAALTQHLVGQHVGKPMHGIYFQNINQLGLSTRL